MITVGGRSLKQIAGALTERRHYHALRKMTLQYPRFPEMLGRYLLGTGRYPFEAAVRTPLGTVTPTLYSRHDVLTVNEIFCREDYRAGPETLVVVDLGSNIGLSALYFLTRSPETRCYLYEPVPENLDRLERNLAAFRPRYELSTSAVGAEAGTVEFGVEETGRYGGIGVATGATIRVDCLAINDVLARVLEKEGHIDILKIDTEGVEEPTLRAIDRKHLARIRTIYAETPMQENPFESEGFSALRSGLMLSLLRTK